MDDFRQLLPKIKWLDLASQLRVHPFESAEECKITI